MANSTNSNRLQRYAVPFKSRGSFWVGEVSNSRAVAECIIILFDKSIPCVMKVDCDRIICLWAEA